MKIYYSYALWRRAMCHSLPTGCGLVQKSSCRLGEEGEPPHRPGSGGHRHGCPTTEHPARTPPTAPLPLCPAAVPTWHRQHHLLAAEKYGLYNHNVRLRRSSEIILLLRCTRHGMKHCSVTIYSLTLSVPCTGMHAGMSLWWGWGRCRCLRESIR